MNCPPSKRQRCLKDDGPTALTSDDPFGDDEDFTQDDLDEIDVIASQAFPQGAPAGLDSKLASYGPPFTPHSLSVVFRGGQTWERTCGRAQQRERARFQQQTAPG